MPTEAEVVGRYNSTRNPANVYDVKRHADGVLSCSCPGWKFSGQPKACRHTRRVLAGLDDDAAVAERNARAGQLRQALRAANVLLYRGGGLYWSPGSQEETDVCARLLVAIEAVGLTAPRPEAAAPRGASRGFRVITLDD